MSGRTLPGSSRVYEVAASVGAPTSAVLTYLRGMGLRVPSPSSAVPPVLAALAAEHFTSSELTERNTP